MVRLVSLCLVLGFAFAAAPARAGDFWGCTDTPYWCTRDAIYAQFKLIARLEADPDVDEAVKGPLITGGARRNSSLARNDHRAAAARVGDDRHAAARRAGGVLLCA